MMFKSFHDNIIKSDHNGHTFFSPILNEIYQCNLNSYNITDEIETFKMEQVKFYQFLVTLKLGNIIFFLQKDVYAGSGLALLEFIMCKKNFLVQFINDFEGVDNLVKVIHWFRFFKYMYCYRMKQHQCSFPYLQMKQFDLGH